MTAYLLRLQDRHLAGARFNLHTGEFGLGRSSSCDLVVHDSTVSRRHARIGMTDGSITVTDLGSLNGTYLDGEQIRAVREVAEDQTLRFGSVSFLVSTNQVCGIELDSALETDKCDQLADGRSCSPALSLPDACPGAAVGRTRRETNCRSAVHQPTHRAQPRGAIFQSFHVHSRAELLATFLHRDNHLTIRNMESKKGMVQKLAREGDALREVVCVCDAAQCNPLTTSPMGLTLWVRCAWFCGPRCYPHLNHAQKRTEVPTNGPQRRC